MVRYSKEINELLQDIEVSESEFESAVSRYESVAEYISDNYKEDEPELYLQGSFKLGTPIKPLTEEGAYDIDIVCCLNAYDKQDISQNWLKKHLGEAVKGYTTLYGMKNIPHDGKRCWTLQYVDLYNFHLDILPAIKNGVEGTEIAITDKQNPYYYKISDNWEVSNPKEYSKWFFVISKHSTYKKEYAARTKQSVEKVPDYRIKTPLQRAIQLFKRHAEVMFENDIEHKPSSIIITTLAAKAFDELGNQVTDFELLLEVLSKNLLKFIDVVDGEKCVLNPVNRKENLSRKWIRDESYYECFLDWQRRLEQDFSIGCFETRIYAFDNLKRSLYKANQTSNTTINIGNLPHHEKSKWKMQLEENVTIEARALKNGWRPIKLRNGETIRKGVELQFAIKAKHLRSYDIFWQVTNTGYEAEKACQLRGDFYNSHIVEGKKVRKETTAYIGEHYVEAYIVKDGICIGKSAPFCVVIR